MVPTHIYRMLTTAFRLAGQRRTFINFEQVRQELPGTIIKTWGSVFTSDVKAKICSEFRPALANAVPREQWMATSDMSSFVKLAMPLKAPHAGEIGEHVTAALVNDLYSELEDEADISVIGYMHTGMDLKLDIDLVDLHDDPFDGRAECKMTRVSQFTDKLATSSPNAMSSDISHYITEQRSGGRAGQCSTRTHYHCLGFS